MCQKSVAVIKTCRGIELNPWACSSLCAPCGSVLAPSARATSREPSSALPQLAQVPNDKEKTLPPVCVPPVVLSACTSHIRRNRRQPRTTYTQTVTNNTRSTPAALVELCRRRCQQTKTVHFAPGSQRHSQAVIPNTHGI